jgi:hypothetical protein
MFTVVLTDVDPKHAGSASGVLNAVQQLGGALGTALIGVVFFGSLTSHAPASFATIEPQVSSVLQSQHIPLPAQKNILSATATCFVDHSREKDTSATPASCKALEKSNGQASTVVSDALNNGAKAANAHNFVTAFKAAVIFEVAVLAVVFALSFVLPRHIRPGVMEEAL